MCCKVPADWKLERPVVVSVVTSSDPLLVVVVPVVELVEVVVSIPVVVLELLVVAIEVVLELVLLVVVELVVVELLKEDVVVVVDIQALLPPQTLQLSTVLLLQGTTHYYPTHLIPLP